MAKILRGEIYWADLDPTVGYEQSGRRPVVILSQDLFNERSGTVIAMAITSQKPRVAFPLVLELLNTGLPKPSWAKISQVRTLSVQRISTRAGIVSAEQLTQLVEGLSEIIAE